jgi:tellurite resistance protein
MQSPTDQEDAYFRKQDQELRQKLREELSQGAADLKQAPRDLSLPGRIQRLGFVGEKLRVFDLMPLVHVAWADGTVTRQEREAILAVALTRVERSSVAFALMESLLEERPPQAFLDESLSLLKLVAGDARAESVVELCIKVASASGGFMNVGNVSSEERAQIEAIAARLGPKALEAFHRELG